jgi:hypothetical protein
MIESLEPDLLKPLNGALRSIFPGPENDDFGTVDSPQIGHTPDPSTSVALRTCTISGPHIVGGGVAARPSPQISVTLRTFPI